MQARQPAWFTYREIGMVMVTGPLDILGANRGVWNRTSHEEGYTKQDNGERYNEPANDESNTQGANDEGPNCM